MAMVGRGVRVGAVAFVAGLSLAGPQALGVAVADGPGVDSSSVSAGPADSRAGAGEAARSGRSSADRAGRDPVGRSPVPAAEASERSARMSVSVVGGSGLGQFVKDPVAPASAVVGSSGDGDRVLQDVIADGGADEPVVSEVGGPEVPVPLAVSDFVDAPAEVAAVTVSAPSSSEQPVVSLELPIAPVGFVVSHVIDTVGTWLSGIPANPIADFLAGGLWLVRRTLFPVGADVGLWGSAACVTTGDCSARDLTGANLVGRDLSAVSFADATLVRSNLAGANLVGADLTGADLTDANVIGALGLFPSTGVGSSGAWNYGQGTDDFWYRTLVADAGGLDTPAPRSWPALRGTPGAPLIGTDTWLTKTRFETEERYPADGVQGIVYNQSNETIAVRTSAVFPNYYTGRTGEERTFFNVWQTAILYPGDAVSYQLWGSAGSDNSTILQYLYFYPTGVDRSGEVYVFGAPAMVGILDPVW